MITPAVIVDKLSITLGGVSVLSQVDVQLPTSKIIGFIGPSGAGKTTLIRAIVGRQAITRGSINVLGMPAGTSFLRSQVGYMGQSTSIYGDLSVSQNLNYFATMLGTKHQQRTAAVTDILRLIDMVPQAKQMVSTLSGGQKQRVSLGIALLGSPKLLVLDEPTVGLDPVLRVRLWQLFRQLADNGTTPIISSHAMDEAAHCDELLLLRGGKVIAQGSPKQLCRQTGTSNIEQSFLSFVQEKA